MAKNTKNNIVTASYLWNFSGEVSATLGNQVIDGCHTSWAENETGNFSQLNFRLYWSFAIKAKIRELSDDMSQIQKLFMWLRTALVKLSHFLPLESCVRRVWGSKANSIVDIWSRGPACVSPLTNYWSPAANYLHPTEMTAVFQPHVWNGAWYMIR